MKLELKAISYNAGLSEETHAYSANLYLDGKKVAVVSNHGHGGCDNQQWLDKAAEAKITAHFAAMPKEATGMTLHEEPFMFQPDLESWCANQVTDFLILRDTKRLCSRAVVGIDDGKEYNFKMKPADLEKVFSDGKGGTITGRAHLLSKYPNMVILNELDDAGKLAAVKAVHS